jgi:hypothetical protein
MIRLLKHGNYSLIQTFDHTKMLILDDIGRYAWISAPEIGDILVTSKKKFNAESVVATGNYRLYYVKDEPNLVDLEHLELFVGKGKWQGYLLPSGLPGDSKTRSRIVPTREVISFTGAPLQAL